MANVLESLERLEICATAPFAKLTVRTLVLEELVPGVTATDWMRFIELAVGCSNLTEQAIMRMVGHDVAEAAKVLNQLTVNGVMKGRIPPSSLEDRSGD